MLAEPYLDKRVDTHRLQYIDISGEITLLSRDMYVLLGEVLGPISEDDGLAGMAPKRSRNVRGIANESAPERRATTPSRHYGSEITPRTDHAAGRPHAP